MATRPDSVGAFLNLIGMPDGIKAGESTRHLSKALKVFRELVRAAQGEAKSLKRSASTPSSVEASLASRHRRELIEALHASAFDNARKNRELVLLIEAATDPDADPDDKHSVQWFQTYAMKHVSPLFIELRADLLLSELAKVRAGRKTAAAVASVLSEQVGAALNKRTFESAFKKRAPRKKEQPTTMERKAVAAIEARRTPWDKRNEL